MESNQCISCKRYRGAGSCEAYPNGIPDKIMTGEADHTKPYKNDNGVRFEPIKGSRV